jgi:hypothetical protein
MSSRGGAGFQFVAERVDKVSSFSFESSTDQWPGTVKNVGAGKDQWGGRNSRAYHPTIVPKVCHITCFTNLLLLQHHCDFTQNNGTVDSRSYLEACMYPVKNQFGPILSV